MCRFLLALKSLMRSSLGVTIVTLSSSHLTQQTVASIYACVDFVISLKTFDSKLRTQSMFKDSHGFFEVVKATNFGGLALPKCLGKKYLFRSLKNRFVIEKIHLPPALEEEVQVKTSSGDNSKKKSLNTEDIDF